MISIYDLKPKFQKLLRPITIYLYNHSVTANQVTISACLISILISTVAILVLPNVKILWLIPFWMLIRMALNAIDGMLARDFHQQSNLGAYLNEMSDVIADSALFLIFIWVEGIHFGMIIACIFLSLLSEYAGVMGPLIGASRRYDGPMGKSDRAFVFGTLSLLLALEWIPVLWVNGVLYIVIILLIYTIYNRVRQGMNEVISKTP